MINVRKADEATIVEFEHGAVNASDLEFLEAFVETLAGLEGPVVLTGAGRAFSAGVDLRRIVEDGDAYVEKFLARLSKALRELFSYPAPTVAAINGHAIAGGCIFALCCDVRLMSGGTIGLAELPVGVAFPRVAMEVVRHSLGTAAQKAVLLGQAVGPDEALRMGMVDEVVAPEDLISRALVRAAAMAHVPPSLYAMTKRDLHAPAMQAIADRPDEALPVWTAPETKQRLTEYLESLASRKR